MDSLRSDAFDTLARLRESARKGDWKSAQVLSTALPRQGVPNDPGELTEYLLLLKEIVILAKAWRSHANASLTRINAATKFKDTGRVPPAGRHNFGV